MKKTTKVWLTIAGVLVLVGCIIFAGVMTMLKWDFTKLSTVKYETNVYEIAEAFRDISITTDTADVLFVPSGDGKCTVECYEAENAKHSVAVENGTLTIKINDSKPWYVYIGFCFSSPRITVYLPQAEYAALSVRAGAGDVEIPKDFAFARADISLTTGNAGVYAAASESIQIKTSTGNIRFRRFARSFHRYGRRDRFGRRLPGRSFRRRIDRRGAPDRSFVQERNFNRHYGKRPLEGRDCRKQVFY